MDTGQPLIELQDVGVAYGGAWALRHVSLNIQKGEILSLVGPNGAGKSTLLKTMMGFVQPAEGTVRLNTGRGVRSVGYVPQKLDIDKTVPFTVGELLTLNMPGTRFWFGGQTTGQRSQAVDVLHQLDACALIDRQIGQLSGGEFQRVMIAYALLQKPQVLLLDEPLTGVDKLGAELLEDLILQLRGERQLTLIIVSHDLHLVSHVSDRVLCLNQTPCGLGSPQEVLQDHLLDEIYGTRRRHHHQHRHSLAA
ncbi:MAG: metal ABC transporter ATP-binding protein [Candidatus Methylacidiphilales bacterium]|nr:metal ABC transporter ATP-binding protein [Candidatus Methylacidiphilales bacterium]